jgi:alkanesulfonate monooxygenase
MITQPRLFSTCPTMAMHPWQPYLPRVVEVARWAERYGCKGILIYSDNRQVDPWFVAQVVIQNTNALAPLIAVQPAYMHPYTVAKLVASLAWLYSRPVALNLVAGGFRNDLDALGDPLAHDKRYDRLTEFGGIIRALLDGETVTLAGSYYKVNRLKLVPPVSPGLVPELFVSGSSDAGRETARTLGAVAVQYPEPPGEEQEVSGDVATGVRIGVIARATSAEAWEIARLRFPEDRRGVLTRQMATKVSDSSWHQQLAETAAASSKRGAYWLEPFERYQTMCPYLVGSYADVAELLSRYQTMGHDTFILDIPGEEDDLRHARIAFEQATTAIAA